MAAETFGDWWAFNMLPSNDGLADDTPPGSDDPPTRWGFTLPTWRYARRIAGFKDIRFATFMTQDQPDMAELARVYFWNRLLANVMPAGVDASVIDFAWTSGGAVMEIQYRLGISADGIIGPITLRAITTRSTFIVDVCDWRRSYYDQCGFHERYPGLYTRAVGIRDLAIKWARDAETEV